MGLSVFTNNPTCRKEEEEDPLEENSASPLVFQWVRSSIVQTIQAPRTCCDCCAWHQGASQQDARCWLRGHVCRHCEEGKARTQEKGNASGGDSAKESHQEKGRDFHSV